jgi:AcrR family transcriptional regulator
VATAERTRQRILDAATEEFAAHGIAGARVDRIAERSGMSKPMLYSYFGAKDRLFDAVFDAHVIANSDRVPFNAADLPGYATRLYDDYLADPALMRLVMWKRLEREGVGYLYRGLEEQDAHHLRDIKTQQQAGAIRADLDPADIWSLLIATAATWAQGSITAVASNDEAPVVHERRRAALAEMVRSGLSPR